MNKWVFPGLAKNGVIISDFKKNKSDDCIRVVAEYYQITKSLLKSGSRLREIVVPRQVCMWMLSSVFKSYSTPQIGKMFNKHHATVLHACKTTEDQIHTDENFRADILLLLNRLGVEYNLKGRKIFVV